ncbi:hypothetical protein GWO43_17465 [candidate division KSB1 bacterium]|nr:hypothetical protein [candidate division KSB1 bacterium]NIR71775.1 hypothetical protein [candidate division KSB1 bacterium]NIS25757.1 hypothetical protein [candidate division KSB1 bacterium]NIT72626.1 hypothetical protein [candidate division KSB1 bacterium]NIU26447.1 hypothetical protein [candidate division KSB1 bacterium]
MNDICVPIPSLAADKTAKVEVTIADKKKRFNFRVEAFEWTPDADLEGLQVGSNRIEQLKRSIQSYDRNWELVQIYNPGPRDRFIHLLFREKQVN